MKSIAQSKCQNATKKLFEALGRVEQVAQEIRWRITNLPEDNPKTSTVIDRLTGESSVVSRLFGEFAALKDLERIDEGNDHLYDSCGFSLLERCEQCHCLLCDDCRHEFGNRILCEECYDVRADDEEDIEPAASSDQDQSAMQAA